MAMDREMLLVCENKMCTGCMACVVQCPKHAIKVQDNISYFNAMIDEDLCVGCNKCRRICQQINPCKKSSPLFWKQGWAEDEEFRASASSGGIASALMYSIINDGGAVVSCELKEGSFVYSSSTDVSCISRYNGSKYAKSNPIDAYKTVDYLLKNDHKVLFIGLPCHVAGIRKYFDENISDNLYLVDLICHGTPSQKLLNMFLEEYGIEIGKISKLNFRKKGSFQVSPKEKKLEPNSIVDRYTIGFLSGLFYTENCYACRYASIDRVSDLTIGDSWGSDLIEEMDRGISLMLCNTPKGKELLDNSDLKLFDVNINTAVKHNGQLDHPSEIPIEREKFFKVLHQKKSFSKAVFQAYPKICIRQGLKAFLINIGLLKTRGGVE